MKEKTGRPVGRPRREDNRGRDVLAAAVELFAGRGFDATSIRDIATAAQVQPASVYYHYPSKEALLVAIVPALLPAAGALRVLATEIPSRRTGAVQQALVRTRDAYEDMFRDLVAA